MRHIAAALFVIAPLAVLAATPPPYLNYQGVLRDAGNRPLDGTYDMLFTFYDALSAGNQILLDQHAAVTSNAVTVSNGLFNASLGGGTLSDGSGPGAYTSLDQVFRDYGTVYLEIRVGAETLSPRVRVVSAGFALNAANLGGKAPATYLDISSSSQTKSGPLTVTASAPSSTGITGGGTATGGVFFDTDNSGYAYLGYGDYGVYGSGSLAGGNFVSTSGNYQALLGTLGAGVQGYGQGGGGFFQDTATGSYAWMGRGGDGVEGYGHGGGGYFKDLDTGSYAWGGRSNEGVEAQGTTVGGSFTASAFGVHVTLADHGTGVIVWNGTSGGQFSSSGGSANLATGGDGINAHGMQAGGFFYDEDDEGTAYAGYGAKGVDAFGREMGGLFYDYDNSGLAYVGYGDRGIWAKGSFAGGTFSDPFSGSMYWADVATPMYKIHGTGTVSFVQNDPDDPGKVIVYAAPEGDEVAVYTRGSGKLVDGVAHVALGETFRLVADPDIGLTAHLTPRGDPIPLAVDSVTPDELVVRGPAGSGASFDFLVYGLRIGFEELATVQAKEREAFLPDQETVDAQYAGRPELRTSNALSRFTAMRRSMGLTGEPDLTRAHALARAIDANRAEIVAAGKAAAEKERATPWRPGQAPAGTQAGPTPAERAGAGTQVASETCASPAAPKPAPEAAFPPGTAVVPIAEPVEAGDVLAMGPSGGLALGRAASASDPRVVGIAAGDPGRAWTGTAPLAYAGTVVSCHVDARYASILPGDLLAASPTPGYAMGAGTAPIQGTVVAKALEALSSGTGTIHVLVMSR